MRPIIGICANHTPKDCIGEITGLGLPGQDWNLLAADYISAIEQAGGCPVIIPVMQDLENIGPLLEILDGILFSGGSDIDPAYYGELPHDELGSINPIRDKWEFALCQYVIKNSKLPILGICRGNQMINVACGGTLYQDIQSNNIAKFNHHLINYPKWYATHKVNIQPDSKLSKIFGAVQIKTNGFNHQAVKSIGNGLKITMQAEDGLVEGIESADDRFIIAVQWHPEMMLERSDEFLCLFKAFVDECGKEG